MMNYGAYLQSTKIDFPNQLASTIMVIIGVCLSGLLVFTVTFSHKLAPTQGPDLVFKALLWHSVNLAHYNHVGFVFFSFWLLPPSLPRFLLWNHSCELLMSTMESLDAPAVFLSSAYWLSAADCTHLTT